jgi:hypothetical protein
MQIGSFDGNGKAPVAAHGCASRPASGTLPRGSVNTGYHDIYDSRRECARADIGPVEIYSMTRRRPGLAGRFPARDGYHRRSGQWPEMGEYPQAEDGFGDDLDGGLRAVSVHCDFQADFIVRHCEPEPGLSAGCHRGGTRIRGPRRVPRPVTHIRVNHPCTRLPRLRKKYIRHEQIPSPLVGHSCGASPSPHITPISSPFPGDIDARACAPGPLTGDIGRGPGTRTLSPGRTPPNSRGKSAPTRCVVGWVESGYVKRGAHDTRHLSSCLVSSSGISGQKHGGRGGR